MGSKIFVSYKYWDFDVAPLSPYSNQSYPTPRHYVSYLDDALTQECECIYKGEDDGEDLRFLSPATIQQKLYDRIYDSTLTIVLISPKMKETSLTESAQWIPQEISYSLRETTRSDRTSRINAMLAVVLPDSNKSYEYYYTPYYHQLTGDHYIIHKRETLFSILGNNMFNEKKPICEQVGSCTVFYGDHSYIPSVKWSDFIVAMPYYLNKAYEIQKKKENYAITVNIVN